MGDGVVNGGRVQDAVDIRSRPKHVREKNKRAETGQRREMRAGNSGGVQNAGLAYHEAVGRSLPRRGLPKDEHCDAVVVLGDKIAAKNNHHNLGHIMPLFFSRCRHCGKPLPYDQYRPCMVLSTPLSNHIVLFLRAATRSQGWVVFYWGSKSGKPLTGQSWHLSCGYVAWS